MRCGWVGGGGQYDVGLLHNVEGMTGKALEDAEVREDDVLPLINEAWPRPRPLPPPPYKRVCMPDDVHSYRYMCMPDVARVHAYMQACACMPWPHRCAYACMYLHGNT